MLPVPIANTLSQSNRMTILDGELGDTATMDLPEETLQMLKETVHIIIHAAASIELKNSLRELSYTVIAPTLCLVKYALKFPNLEKFVFLSSAYVNAHLWKSSKS
jgi:thioester reductase-like protein